MIDTVDVYEATTEALGSHNELGIDADGWHLCSVLVEVPDATTEEVCVVRVHFTHSPDWSEWDMSDWKVLHTLPHNATHERRTP